MPHKTKVLSAFRPIAYGDLRQLVGLVEGEGSLIWQKARTKAKAAPMLQITMTDRDVVQWAANLLNVGITAHSARSPRHKPYFSVRAWGWRAMSWMVYMFPYLGARRRAKVEQLLTAFEHN